jgi:hypothetical protein
MEQHMDLLMGVILGSTLAFTGLWLAGLVLRIVFAKKYPVPKAGSAIVITGEVVDLLKIRVTGGPTR